jgi:hypothetical protein
MRCRRRGSKESPCRQNRLRRAHLRSRPADSGGQDQGGRGTHGLERRVGGVPVGSYGPWGGGGAGAAAHAVSVRLIALDGTAPAPQPQSQPWGQELPHLLPRRGGRWGRGRGRGGAEPSSAGHVQFPRRHLSDRRQPRLAVGGSRSAGSKSPAGRNLPPPRRAADVGEQGRASPRSAG